MPDRQDLDVLGMNLVDDAVLMVDQLSDRRLIPLWDNPPLLWEPGKRGQALLQAVEPLHRPSWSVLRDEVDDLASPFQGARRPDDPQPEIRARSCAIADS